MFLLKNNQAFNIFADKDAKKNEVQGTGDKSYIQFSVAAWNANKNQDGSFKKKGDQGYEVAVFATAFGKTAEKISAALKAASDNAQDGEVARAAFKIGKGCYVKKTSYVTEKDGVESTTYNDNYVFGNVEVMELNQNQENKEAPVGKEEAPVETPAAAKKASPTM